MRQDEYDYLNIAFLDFLFMGERSTGLFNRFKWYLNEFDLMNVKTEEMMNRYQDLSKNYRRFHFFTLKEYARNRDFFATSSPKLLEMADRLDELIIEEQLILDGMISNISF